MNGFYWNDTPVLTPPAGWETGVFQISTKSADPSTWLTRTLFTGEPIH